MPGSKHLPEKPMERVNSGADLHSKFQKRSTEEKIRNVPYLKIYFTGIILALKYSGLLPVSFGIKCWWKQLRLSVPALIWQIFVISAVTFLLIQNVANFPLRSIQPAQYLYFAEELSYYIFYYAMQAVFACRRRQIYSDLEHIIHLCYKLHPSFWVKMNLCLTIQVLGSILFPLGHFLFWEGSTGRKIAGCFLMYSIWVYASFYANILAVLLTKLEEVNKSMVNSAVHSNNFKLITRSLTTCYELWHAVEGINSAFGGVNANLVILSLAEFLIGTDDTVSHHQIRIISYIWLFFYVIILLKLAIPSSLLASEINKTGRILTLFTLDNDDQTVVGMIETHLLRLRHQSLVLHGGVFFSLDMRLVMSVIGATITYGVVIIQFRSGKEFKHKLKSSLFP